MKAKLPRLLRLLPSLVLGLAALLVLNGTGLVRDGAALAQTSISAAAASLTETPQPANADYAEPDQQIASAAEADILTSLSRRRGELDARDAKIKLQADILAATEKRVDAKIAQLQTLQNKIAALLADRDAAQKAQITALVKTYSAMKPADAARIFDALPDTHFHCGFGHLSGYTSAYYTYMWSLVIAKDLFSAFDPEDLFAADVALRYRDTVLAAGGSKDAADLVADFLGRPYDSAAFKRWLSGT